jgi:hypothetical protein
MKERPILFNGEMVKAILDGRKTQTRRVVKPQPQEKYDRLFRESGGSYGWWHSPSTSGQGAEQQDLLAFPQKPFGTIGDRLWVRETFRLFDSSKECACYDDCRCVRGHGKPVYRADADSEDKWTPSIHMPRWASRITLEITGVRVERLNDISDFDAFQEGAPSAAGTITGPYCMSFKQGFRNLWQSIYGNWEANPWVWVYEFRKI